MEQSPQLHLEAPEQAVEAGLVEKEGHLEYREAQLELLEDSKSAAQMH